MAAIQVPRDALVGKLSKLTQSQQSIESVATFCIFYAKDARNVVQIWTDEFYKAPQERQMALLYLANHILQVWRDCGGCGA
jgi:regulator of Ty1 transposition protein 103